jgi:hypothetical protein
MAKSYHLTRISRIERREGRRGPDRLGLRIARLVGSKQCAEAWSGVRRARDARFEHESNEREPSRAQSDRLVQPTRALRSG